VAFDEAIPRLAGSATIALAIFVLEKSNRGLRGLNGSEEICVSSAYPRFNNFSIFLNLSGLER